MCYRSISVGRSLHTHTHTRTCRGTARPASQASVAVAHSLCHVDCWQWHNLCEGTGRQHGHSRSQSRSEQKQTLSGRLSVSAPRHTAADPSFLAFPSHPSTRPPIRPMLTTNLPPPSLPSATQSFALCARYMDSAGDIGP